jgi:hypothetical protein
MLSLAPRQLYPWYPLESRRDGPQNRFEWRGGGGRKCLPLPALELRHFGRPACSQSLLRLRYSGSQKIICFVPFGLFYDSKICIVWWFASKRYWYVRKRVSRTICWQGRQYTNNSGSVMPIERMECACLVLTISTDMEVLAYYSYMTIEV